MAEMSIARRLFLLGCLSVVLVGGIGGLATSMIKEANALARFTDSIRASVEADMLHDAIRGDVYSGLLASNQAERDKARDDLTGHAKELDDRLALIADKLSD